MKGSLHHLDFDQENYIDALCSGGFVQKNIHNPCYTTGIILCILEENFQKPTCLIFFSFVSIFLLRQINSNNFELIHLIKNMKTKENC